MIRVFKIFIGLILTIIGIFALLNYPVSSDAKALPRLADTINIKKCLELVINTSKPRYYKNVNILDSVAERIKSEFSKYTDSVVFQEFTVNDAKFKNVIASFGPVNAERIIVGAHYDVCLQQDGADDNASGVAGILELARLLQSQPLKYRIDLVAYSLEEPPFFGTTKMGSYVHAKSLKDGNAPVLGMISLEMIGYYSDEENSQTYPIGLLEWIYGGNGNFITIVQKSMCGKFAKLYKEFAFQNNTIITKSFRAPSFVGGIGLSDHRNYWEFNYSAIMITNTSFYRNHNYHLVSDVLSSLDIKRMGLTIEGVYRTLVAFQK